MTAERNSSTTTQRSSLLVKLLGASLVIILFSFGLVWYLISATLGQSIDSLSTDRLIQDTESARRSISNFFKACESNVRIASQLDIPYEVIDEGDPKSSPGTQMNFKQITHIIPRYLSWIATVRLLRPTRSLSPMTSPSMMHHG